MVRVTTIKLATRIVVLSKTARKVFQTAISALYSALYKVPLAFKM